jgi:hypothetical protein
MHLFGWRKAVVLLGRERSIAAIAVGARRCECVQTFLFAVAIFLALAPNAWPTTFVKMSLEQLTAAAPLIVRARCQGSIVSTEKSEIWTITSFEVREVWKGSAPQVVRVRLLGGRTNELTSHVEGVPRFRPGEDVVLFLAPLRRGNYSVTSWAQGTFRIRRAGANAQLVVTQDTVAFSPAEFTGRSASHGVDGSAVRGMPLEEFRHRVAESIPRQR